MTDFHFPSFLLGALGGMVVLALCYEDRWFYKIPRKIRRWRMNRQDF